MQNAEAGTVSDVPWRANFETLKASFQAAAQAHPGLRCVMIHAGPGERQRLEDKPLPCSESKIIEGGAAIYGMAPPPAVRAQRRWYYVGDRAAVSLFLMRATEAGRTLAAVPENALSGIVRCSRYASGPSERWLWSLFDLAWKRRPGSPLYARKLIWDRQHLGITTLSYDQAEIRRLLTIGTWAPEPPEFLQRWAIQLPDYFCSELPDLFMACVYAIDILVATEDAAPIELAQYCFRRNGQMWEIRFDKESGYSPTKKKGFGIILQLLRFPDPQQPLHAIALLGRDPRSAPRAGGSEGILDAEGQARLRQRHKTLLEEKAKAERDGDALATQECQKELSQLAAASSEAFGIEGKDRPLGAAGAAESARSSVRKNLDRAYEDLRTAHPPCLTLLEHLRANIRTEGDNFAYRPAAPLGA